MKDRVRTVSDEEMELLASQHEAREGVVEAWHGDTPERYSCPWCRCALLDTVCMTGARALAICENCGRWVKRDWTAGELFAVIADVLKKHRQVENE